MTSGDLAGTLQKLKWLTGFRLLLTSLFLGSAVVLDFHERLPFPTAPLYSLLTFTFGLSLLYALALRKQSHLALLATVQLALDLGLVSLLVHFTGGLESAFPFMHIFVIFAAANLFQRRGSLAMAILCSGLYAGLAAAEWTRIISPVEFTGSTGLPRPGYVVYQVLVHCVAFLAVGILSGHLVERLRQAGQELEQRGLDLRSLQTLHRAIVANVPSGLMTLDLAGRVISFNQAAERITGFDYETLRNRSWQETPFAAYAWLADFYSRPGSHAVSPPDELYLRRRDGRAIPVGIACSPLRSPDGGMVGLVAIFQDLTERKRVDEQLRRADRLAALGQLAANIAHEIRNPLAALSGSAEVLKEDLSLAGPNRQLLEIILREARRLKLITGQFLDFSKPLRLLFRPCAVRPILEETLHLLARSAERHPNTSWTVTEDEPLLFALADSDQFRQVVWNLCLNAMQAMPQGGNLTITLRRIVNRGPQEGRSRVRSSGSTDSSLRAAASMPPLPGEEEEGWVEILFQDTGRGIPREDLERIFDPFFTTRPSGTGLGLAIARKILESMGGRIWVDSRPGEGTTFRVWLRPAPAGVPAPVQR